MLNKKKHYKWDERREIVVPGDHAHTLDFCVEHFISCYSHAVKDHNAFYVALSGGSTPKAIYQMLTSDPYCEQIDWAKVHLFWSDERSVPANHPDSNYLMAMQSGFSEMPIPPHQIHRMIAENEIETHALQYENLIKEHLKGKGFDLMMLGMGDDGHTASLFPNTEGLVSKQRWVIANFVPQKKTWRMSTTFDCINASRAIAIYVLGAGKQSMVEKVFLSSDPLQTYPVQRVGTKEHKALWIMDQEAAVKIIEAKAQ